MKRSKKDIARLFLLVGVVFLIIGLVQQNFLLTFKSGLFNLGVIFPSQVLWPLLWLRSHSKKNRYSISNIIFNKGRERFVNIPGI